MRIHFEYMTEDVVRCSVSGPSRPARAPRWQRSRPSRNHGRGGTARAVQQRTADHRRQRRRPSRRHRRTGGVVVGGQRPPAGRDPGPRRDAVAEHNDAADPAAGFALVYVVAGETRYVRAAAAARAARPIYDYGTYTGPSAPSPARADHGRGRVRGERERHHRRARRCRRHRCSRARSWSPRTDQRRGSCVGSRAGAVRPG